MAQFRSVFSPAAAFKKYRKINNRFRVFHLIGVATEYCARCAAADGLLRKGRRVVIVTDAIKALNEGKGQEVLNELEARGARLISTEEVMARISASSNAAA